MLNEVPTLKQHIDGDIVVAGTLQLVRTLIEHDLVDELLWVSYRIVVRGSACEAASCTSRSGTPASRAAVIKACRSVCGVTSLAIPARRAVLRTIRPRGVPVQPPPVRSDEHRPSGPFADGQVDRPGGPRC